MDSDFASASGVAREEPAALEECAESTSPCLETQLDDDDHRPKSCANGVCWPLVIFVILAIIVLVAVLFSKQMDGQHRAWTFFGLLIVVLVWSLILWFFCRCGQQTIAWFLLLLPVALVIFWALAEFLAGVTGGCGSKSRK